MRIATSIALLLALCASLPAQRKASELLARLSLREKAGQLLMSWTLSSIDAKERAKLIETIDGAGLGGVILSKGTAAQVASVIGAIQKGRSIPLLCAGDLEAGVGYWIREATDFGTNMLIGATGSSRLSEAAGRATAEEAHALGYHWCFAPVVDVNINPANPIINVRSFGEDPAAVGRLGAAFVRGVEAGDVLAAAKHFPGHGDVTSDSHVTMPTVPGNRERLERVELPPFRAAIGAGVSSIMTAHVAVPGLGEDPGIPATLSHPILTGLLRKKLGFRGLIVTDALDMGGVHAQVTPEDAAILALNAGADVLLMPPDAIKTRDAIAEAVRDGKVSRKRLDEAVLRILRAKERMGLLSGRRLGPAADWRGRVASERHRALADEIATRGLTLVRDHDGLVPIAEKPKDGVFVVVTGAEDDGRGARIGAALTKRGYRTSRVHAGTGPTDIERTAAMIRDSGSCIVAFGIDVPFQSSQGIPEELAPVVTALRVRPQAVAISLGNPYLIRDFPEVSTYLCAYEATEHTERAVVAGLTGQAAITGRIPVRIPRICDAGAGLTVLPPGPLADAKPFDQGLPDDLPIRIRRLCTRAIRDGAFPGASVCVTRRGNVVARVAAGRETYDLDSKIVTPNTVYDLASLTKVCATTPTVLRLAARGVLDLDAKVANLVPSFRGEHKDTVTIRHLLTHSSGLPPYIRFFKTMKGKANIVEAAATTELKTVPGAEYRYSDLGLILLMACAEKAAGIEFDALVQREVFEPLGMASARFAKPNAPVAAPPTEDDPFRKRVVQGEVHDENAWAMGGVSGHAGLFANAIDVATLANAFLGGGRGWLPAPLTRRAITRANVVEGSSRALGWDTFVSGRSAGTAMSDAAFGHTGFTGTSVWSDPATDVCIVLLTNRVHPTRENKKIFAVRRELADLVMGCLEGSR